MTRYQCYARLDRVLTEYYAATFSTAHVLDRLSRGETGILPRPASFSPRDIRTCSQNLEITYLLRLFGAFEGILRDYWAAQRKKVTRVMAETLVACAGAKTGASQTTIDEVQEVREQRNLIVHHDHALLSISIEECNSRLSTFVSYMPKDW